MISPTLLATVAVQTHAPVLIADAAGLTLWINPAFEALSGYGIAALRGRKPSELLHGAATSPAAVRQMSEALKDGRPVVALEVLNYTRDGRPYWIELDITPVRDETGTLTHFVALQTPLGARRQAQQAIAELSQRLHMALGAARLGVWEMSDTENGLLLDTQARRWIAAPADAAGGPPTDARTDAPQDTATATPAEVLPWHRLPEALGRWRDAARQALADDTPVDIEAWLHIGAPEAGARRCLRITGQRMGADGQRRVIGVLADVTAPREAQARAEAEALDAMLRVERHDVLGRLRREFRMPLNSLLGFAQLVRVEAEHSGSGGIAQRIEHIESAGLRLLDMLDELLAAAEPAEGGRATLQPVRLREALARQLPREVALIEHGAGLQDTAVWADPTMLRRMLSLAGGLGLHPGASGSGPRLTALLQEPGHVALQFSYPATGAAATAVQGIEPGNERGLRLDLIRRLLHEMGGECELADAAADLQMTLRLRVARGLDEGSEETAAPPAPAAVWSTRHDVAGHVVYVEDDPGNVAVIEHALLTRPGVQLRVAGDADAALALLAAGPRPGLVLIDLVLPGRSGRDLLLALRQDTLYTGVPCVVLTSIDDIGEEAELRALGADDYLVKPLRLDRLLGLVDGCLGAQQPPA